MLLLGAPFEVTPQRRITMRIGEGGIDPYLDDIEYFRLATITWIEANAIGHRIDHEVASIRP